MKEMANSCSEMISKRYKKHQRLWERSWTKQSVYVAKEETDEVCVIKNVSESRSKEWA